MTTNPNAHTILCYGDSNTYGQRSDTFRKRWPVGVRWTSQLQQLLGDDYYLIEEGLSSRTTDLDYARKPGRNGKTYLQPCLESHNPIDTVILMLGTNDLKVEFDRSAADIAAAVKDLISIIKQYANRETSISRIVVMSPGYVEERPQPPDSPVFYDHASVQKSHELATYLEKVAQEEGCLFLDAALLTHVGEDGIHLDKESHAALAAALRDLLTTS